MRERWKDGRDGKWIKRRREKRKGERGVILCFQHVLSAPHTKSFSQLRLTTKKKR